MSATCLEGSPTALWWQQQINATDRWRDLKVQPTPQSSETGSARPAVPDTNACDDNLQAHIEEAADYDGLAVVWGIGNKKATAEDCAAQCFSHRPGVVPGEGRQPLVGNVLV